MSTNSGPKVVLMAKNQNNRNSDLLEMMGAKMPDQIPVQILHGVFVTTNNNNTMKIDIRKNTEYLSVNRLTDFLHEQVVMEDITLVEIVVDLELARKHLITKSQDFLNGIFVQQ